MLLLDQQHDKMLLCYLNETEVMSLPSTSRFEGTLLLQLKPGLPFISYGQKIYR
jgi:hypothetical protein